MKVELFLIFICFLSFSYTLSTITIGVIFPLTTPSGTLDPTGNTRLSAVKYAVDKINNDPNILPNTTLQIKIYDTKTSVKGALESLIKGASNDGVQFFIGPTSSNEVTLTAIGATLYNVMLVSPSATSSDFSDKSQYPNFNRLVGPDSAQGKALAKLVNNYGWNNISAISTAETYGLGGVQAFIDASGRYRIEMLSYQQFVSGATNITQQMTELKNSKSRIFLAFTVTSDFQTVLREAINQELIGGRFVWFGGDAVINPVNTYIIDGIVDYDLRKAARGLIGTNNREYVPGVEFDEFLQGWLELDPTVYYGAGSSIYPTKIPICYDTVYAYAYAFHNVLQNNPDNFTVERVQDELRSNVFTGASGVVELDSNGDRLPEYQVLNLRKDSDRYQEVGVWIWDQGLILNKLVEFYDGRTVVPDLDVREPVKYWSCYDRQSYVDTWGKNVTIVVPKNNNPNNIDYDYRCDQYLDCNNLSDEMGCNPNIVAAFITFGIINPILILSCIIFIIFTIVHGYVIPHKRVRASSPTFLLIIIIACIVGYCSTFTWFGRPAALSCFLQPWILSIAVVVMISSLFAKTFRIWYLFRNSYKVKRLPDRHLFLIIVVLTIPAILILILWSILGTNLSGLATRDGKDHWVCIQSGVVGVPMGVIFFFILVAYIGLVLLIGVLLTILTWKIPSEFNESKLIAISIYNLVFLAIVVIPVYAVLMEKNPVAAFIILQLAILYAFTATLWLQFIPKMIGVYIIDNIERTNVGRKLLKGVNNRVSSVSTVDSISPDN